MGKVVLARVDSRLIHGQVATNVSKQPALMLYLLQMIIRQMMNSPKILFWAQVPALVIKLEY